MSLLRVIPTEGKIYYDGVPIDSLNLEAVRSKITIIPQVVRTFTSNVSVHLLNLNQAGADEWNAETKPRSILRV